MLNNGDIAVKPAGVALLAAMSHSDGIRIAAGKNLKPAAGSHVPFKTFGVLQVDPLPWSAGSTPALQLKLGMVMPVAASHFAAYCANVSC